MPIDETKADKTENLKNYLAWVKHNEEIQKRIETVLKRQGKKDLYE